MAKYQCPGCKYTYDETLGHPHEGFPAGTAWANVPDEWACPDCAVRDKVDFELIGEAPAATTPATQAVEFAGTARSAVPVTDTAVIEKPASPMSKPAARMAAVPQAAEALPPQLFSLQSEPGFAENKPFVKWVCITCGHIYDEALGDPSGGIAAGTRFEEIPRIGVARSAAPPRKITRFARKPSQLVLAKGIGPIRPAMEVIVNIHADPNDIPLVDTRSTVADVFAKQREAGWARRSDFDRKARIAALNRLREVLQRRETDIIAALYADFRKPESEVRLTEILPVLQEIAHTKRHLKGWMRSRRAAATLGVFGTRARIRPEPKGICLIIAPWNYPLNLAFGPLVSALAAGNSAIIKPSELTPATSTLIADIVAETFSPDLVAVVEGDAAVAQELLALPFDHIFFTGSPQVGKLVMEAAAKSLASVTLELGGKSPTIVGPTANLKKAARNIVWGKFANNGQTCIAPDHVFVHRDIAQEFNETVMAEIGRVYGKTPEVQKMTPDYCRIVNDRHFNRVAGLIEDARAKSARILLGGQTDAVQKFVAPTLISQITPEMAISREELFGPILPIIEYDDIDKVIDQINANPKPLALYVFDNSRAFAEDIITRTSSGAVGINLTVVHFLHPNLPFGGVNNSGIGAAHGVFGFRAFSHEKAVLQDRYSIVHMLFPPYTGFVKRLIRLVVKVLG